MCSDESEKEQNDIFEQYKRLQVHEKQYNTHLIELRKLASAWLLAAFAGIGFMLKGVTDMIDPNLGIALVSFIGAIGIFVLWLLDHHVYFKLLNSAIYQAIKMEFENKDTLPQIRKTNLLTCGDLSIFVEAFYLIPICILLLISAICLTFFVNTIFGCLALITVVLILIIFINFSVFRSRPIKFSEFADKMNESKEFIQSLKEEKRAWKQNKFFSRKN